MSASPVSAVLPLVTQQPSRSRGSYVLWDSVKKPSSRASIREELLAHRGSNASHTTEGHHRKRFSLSSNTAMRVDSLDTSVTSDHLPEALMDIGSTNTSGQLSESDSKQSSIDSANSSFSAAEQYKSDSPTSPLALEPLDAHRPAVTGTLAGSVYTTTNPKIICKQRIERTPVRIERSISVLTQIGSSTTRALPTAFFHDIQQDEFKRRYVLKIYMPHMEGGDLNTKYAVLRDFFAKPATDRQGELQKQDLFLYLLRNMLRSLHELHRNGITHSDIKPENILLTQKLTPHMGDIDGAVLSRNFAEEGSFGTFAYQAPEGKQHSETVETDGQKSDVFGIALCALDTVAPFSIRYTAPPEMSGQDMAAWVHDDWKGPFQERLQTVITAHPFLQPFQPILEKMLDLSHTNRWDSKKALEVLNPLYRHMMQRTDNLVFLRTELST